MKTLNDLAGKIISFINTVAVPLVFAVALIVFLYGVYKYFILGGGNEEKRSEGRRYIMIAIIGFAIMTSVWGLVNVVTNTFGLNSQGRPCLPTFGKDPNCSGSQAGGTSQTASDQSPSGNAAAPVNSPSIPTQPDPNTPSYDPYGPPPVN